MMSSSPQDWRPPWRYLPLELRAPLEAARAHLLRPNMRDWPRGHGRPVLVIPGFGQSHRSTEALRGALKRQDFQALDWGLGRNMGSRRGMSRALIDQLGEIRQAFGQPAAIVGWSLGGVIGRELARKQSDLVSHVISLGSPIGGPHATTLQPLFSRINPATAGAGHDPERYQPPPVPCTAIFTRQDGIVAWQSAREPDGQRTENIEVTGSHMGLGFNPAVWFAICYRLSPDTCDRAYPGQSGA